MLVFFLIFIFFRPVRSHLCSSKLKFMGCLFAQNMVGKPLHLIYFPQDNNPFLLVPELYYEYELFLQVKHVRAAE